METINKNRIRVCLIGASFDTCNMGVSALAESSIKCIFSRWPNAEVTLLGSGRSAGEFYLKVANREVLVRQVPIRFCLNIFVPLHFVKFLFYACLLKLLPFSSLRRFLMERNSSLKSILQADLFADITGGDSFSDIYGFRRFAFCFVKKLLPIMFNKELMLLPQTYGPFKSPLTKIMARYVLRKAKLIFSRDQDGANTVNGLLPNYNMKDKMRIVPDVAFVLDSRKPSNMDISLLPDFRTEESIVVGINVSGLLYYGGYTGNNMFGLKGDYGRIISRIIDFMMSKGDVLVLLVPHIFPPDDLVEKEIAENDVAACIDIYKKFSEKYQQRIFMVNGRYDQSEIKYIIGQCNFFLGSRMHSCIAALSQNIPAVGLAYSRKFVGVFDSVGVANLVIDLTTTMEKSILALLDKAFSDREALGQKLSQTIPEAQKAILDIFRQGTQDKHKRSEKNQ
jgi:colanic acid/amylovoran biosynthesis protein